MKKNDYKLNYMNTQTSAGQSGGPLFLWDFDLNESDPTIILIGIHSGYDKQEDVNFGLCFMDIDRLIELFGKQKWQDFFKIEGLMNEELKPTNESSSPLVE